MDQPAGTYRVLAALAGTGPVDSSAFTELLDFIDTHQDCSDFRLLVVLRMLLAAGDRLAPADAARAATCVQTFRYWVDEPGTDDMCRWSENHQLLFGVCQYLAGQLFPDVTFSSDGRLGSEHRDAAQARLLRWLEQRFRYGFSEWLSPVYYEEDVAGLVVLIDHSGDDDLVARATAVLDLLLLDVALHLSNGVFSTSSGRCYAEQKQHPARAEMQLITAAAFGTPGPAAYHQLGMLFVLRDGYDVPAAVTAIASDESPREVRYGAGQPLSTISREPISDDTIMAMWAMEAFVNADAIEATMTGVRRWNIDRNAFLTDLAPLRRVPTRLLKPLVRVLNPVAQGTALEPVDVMTFRTASGQLSSAQHYRPGGFGDQHHLWQALLPDGVGIFATHPGAALVADGTRQRTPNEWVGNGVNPQLAQDGPLLLACYDTRVRRGFGEGPRVSYSHLYLPQADLDDVVLTDRVIGVRKGDALLGIVALHPLTVASAVEVRQSGPVSGWAVLLADVGEYGSLAGLIATVSQWQLTHHRSALQLDRPGGPTEARQHRLADGQLWIDRVRQLRPLRRYASQWVNAALGADQIEVTAAGHRLLLDYQRGRVPSPR